MFLGGCGEYLPFFMPLSPEYMFYKLIADSQEAHEADLGIYAFHAQGMGLPISLRRVYSHNQAIPRVWFLFR